MSDQAESSSVGARLLRALGPGLVTACVVIGPGSILTSSKLGADEGYSKIWVVVISVIVMMTYVNLGMRLGVVTQQSNAELVSKHIHRAISVLIGLSVFFISAAFQFGNNLGAHSALTTYIDFPYWPIVLNAGVLAVLFGFRNLYTFVERAMACFVALMLLAFAINLGFSQPDPGEFFSGFIPLAGSAEIGLPLLGLIGTTFVISAAYYQSYLVRFKGWTEKDFRRGVIDSRVSATIMGVITIMIMSTSASVLRGADLQGVGDVANSLKPLFGEKGRAIFCLGLFSAAFSSFIVNSMIGGFILSDALRLGSTPQDRWPRLMTAAVLLIGMGVAMYVIETGVKPVPAIVAAQAATVLAAPLIAGAMLWLTNMKSVMGEHRNGWLVNTLAGFGFVLLLGMSLYTLLEKVLPALGLR